MIEGSILIGSAAAKGIAPSVIPIHPIISAAFPDSCSATVNLFFPMNVASASPNGGVHTAVATAAIRVGLVGIIATAKKNAVLFIGPPISKAIIAPNIIPSTILELSCIPESHVSNVFIISAIGSPTNRSIIIPDMNVPTNGIINIGITELITLGTFICFR